MDIRAIKNDFFKPIETARKIMADKLNKNFVTIDDLQTLVKLSAKIKEQSEMVCKELTPDADKVYNYELDELKYACYLNTKNYLEACRRKKKQLDSLISYEIRYNLIEDFRNRRAAPLHILEIRERELVDSVDALTLDQIDPDVIKLYKDDLDNKRKEINEYNSQTNDIINLIAKTNRINPFYEIADTLKPVFNFSRKKQKRFKGIDSLMKKKRKYKKAPKTYQDFFVEKEEAAKFADFLRSYAKTNKNGLCPGDVYKLYVECLQRLKLLNTTAFHLSYKTFGDLLSQLNTNGVIIYKYKGCSIKFGSPYDSDFIKALDAFVALRG